MSNDSEEDSKHWPAVPSQIGFSIATVRNRFPDFIITTHENEQQSLDTTILSLAWRRSSFSRGRSDVRRVKPAV